MPIANSVLDLMRNSPLVELNGAGGTGGARLLAKLELALPGGMKDRVALEMIEDAEASGQLAAEGTVIESSSGTLAEGLARVCAVKGYRCVIVTDPRIDALTLAKLEALGAEVDVVSEYHPRGGWQLARLERLAELRHSLPGVFWTRQYDNPSNPGAYERRMADELVDTLGSKVDVLVASVGSGGSLCGTARSLKDRFGSVRVVAVDAVGSGLFHQPVLHRLQSGHGNNVVAGNIDYRVIDEVHWLADGEAFLG